eukprot:6459376-Amphidinium_carterae.3
MAVMYPCESSPQRSAVSLSCSCGIELHMVPKHCLRASTSDCSGTLSTIAYARAAKKQCPGNLCPGS